ncbi:MAG: site-specific integrase, partial [Candidatus Omnitrophica bacterium]|nr:site-specific integrase [Candidatus Omnitrophota bacterium]
KTGRVRTSHLPRGVMNEVTSLLRDEGRLGKRDFRVRNPDSFLFYPHWDPTFHYTENRLRQIFRLYAERSSLDHEYGRDKMGRRLHRLTIHSLRHSHIMHYIHVHKLPLPIVQKQVGHRSLRSTSVYLNPSDEAVGEAYRQAQSRVTVSPPRPSKNLGEKFKYSRSVVIPQ